VVEEAHLSWKRRLDGYCACTAIVKEGKGRQENEKRMGGGLAQAAGGRSRRRKLALVVLIARVQFPAVAHPLRTLAFKNLRSLPCLLAWSGTGRGDGDGSRVRRNQREKLNGEEGSGRLKLLVATETRTDG
jgi:hypothetical protein